MRNDPQHSYKEPLFIRFPDMYCRELPGCKFPESVCSSPSLNLLSLHFAILILRIPLYQHVSPPAGREAPARGS